VNEGVARVIKQRPEVVNVDDGTAEPQLRSAHDRLKVLPLFISLCCQEPSGILHDCYLMGITLIVCAFLAACSRHLTGPCIRCKALAKR
jgi:hypothetical protein